MQLTSHQSEQLARATAKNVGLLTGNPGSGKTTTVASYIRSLQSNSNGHGGIAVAAPTGKAARRITESLRGHGLNLDATTIHRLLGYTYADGHGFFTHGRSIPLPYSYVFVDESSMIDASLMASLLAARRRNSKFLFIGDPNQLPPVGHGAPLRDMIAMRLPHGHLSEPHRNAGRIVLSCKSIVEKKRFEYSEELDIQEGENLFVDREWKTTDEQIAVIRDWLHPTSAIFDIDRVTDPIWDVQVIVPLNKKSDVAREPLNKKLQNWLNPNGEQKKGNPFRVGDKIVCSKNGWYIAAPGCPIAEQNEEGKVYCANGEQARVVEVHERWTIVDLTLPERQVRIGKSKGDDDSDTGRWELAFAISAHKAQGAEWPVVIVVGDESNGARYLCDRHWLLTAISRGQQATICVAKPTTLQDWCRKTHLNKRKTFSVEKYFELLVK